MKKMYVAGWSFTNRCNYNCMHCYNNSGRKHDDELSEEEVKTVSKKLIDFGVAAVNFGGGECPLRDDFFDVCKTLYDGGIKLSLTTNGSTYEKTSKYLGLFHDVGISLDFADSGKQDYFRGVKGVYEKAIEAVDFFVKNNIDTEIVSCINKLNCNEYELKKLYNLAKDHGVNYWRLNRYRPTGRDNIEKLALSANELKKAYSTIDELLKQESKEDFVMPDPLFSQLGRAKPCPCGTTSFKIQANGEVSPCVYIKLSGGNIIKNSIEEILDSSTFKSIRNRELDNTKCASCNKYAICKGGCAASAYLQYKTFDMPDPLCWQKEQARTDKDWNVHENYLCTAYVPLKKENRPIGPGEKTK